MSNDTSILIHIHRKAQFRACLLPYHIYINGRYAGMLKNGESLTVEHPRADSYLIQEGGMPFDGCIAFSPERDSVISIELLTKGGWASETHPVFTSSASTMDESVLIPLSPAFAVIRDAYCKKIPIDSLSEKDRILLHCYDFWICFSDDGALGEVAAQENAVEMMTALRTIGAVRLADFCEKAFRDVLGDAALPLENIGTYEDKLAELDDYLRRNTRITPNGQTIAGMDLFRDELRQCAARFILGTI